MAIYTEKDLFKKETIKVRFYKYTNMEEGLGDEGTAFYATFPVKAFNKKDLVFQTEMKLYDLKPEYDQKIRKILGSDWRNKYSFEEVNMKRFKEEIEDAKHILEVASNRRDFS